MAEQLGERWELHDNLSPLTASDDDKAKYFKSGWDAAMREQESTEVESDARMARIETKQDALYAEIHAVHLKFDELLTGVMGAMQSNPLLSRLFGGGRK